MAKEKQKMSEEEKLGNREERSLRTNVLSLVYIAFKLVWNI